MTSTSSDPSAHRDAYYGLSVTMKSALGSLPVTLKSYDNGETYMLPFGSPSAATLKALERRGLAYSANHPDKFRGWDRTALGEALWMAR